MKEHNVILPPENGCIVKFTQEGMPGLANIRSALRDFAPEDQVHARLQLSGKGWIRKPVAGVDVRGDGMFVPYRGGVRREELDPTHHETPFDLVRETLEQDAGS